MVPFEIRRSIPTANPDTSSSTIRVAPAFTDSLVDDATATGEDTVVVVVLAEPACHGLEKRIVVKSSVTNLYLL